LVGAGPGDIDLITIKGAKAIAEADVILYDALVSPELLGYAPKRAIIKYVGKRAGQHSYSQSEINELIVGYALQKGHVVRLKGGDPFIFGRGYEELKHAEAFGIETQVIPGISSSYAAPALANIPLTSRGISESFWVLTGTTKEGQLPKDMALAAQSSATIVILMGMGHLDKICSLFTCFGKHDTPVAIVQNGSTPHQKIGVGTISSIQTTVYQQNLGAPATIVIGDVVKALLEINFQELETRKRSFKHSNK